MEREISKLRSRRVPMFEASEVGTGKTIADQEASLTNGRWYPGGDTYFHYRSMIMAASYPDLPKISPYGPTGDFPFSAAYTQEEDEMISMAAKICGYPGKRLGTSKSTETEEINKVSPCSQNSGKNSK